MEQKTQALIDALRELIWLHETWDKGTAYIPVAFMHKNNAAIAAAKAAIVAAKEQE
jgi:hypothetical protein